eukprot:2925574-Amphidinium_carterae.1
MQLFDRRVAMFLPRICDTPFTQVRAALQCTSRRSLWSAWLPVLQRMRENVEELGTMAVPVVGTFPAWLAMMTVAGSRWK